MDFLGHEVTKRYIFRQVDHRDLQTFLQDGEIRSKNATPTQPCHQTSYPSIVHRRGTAAYAMPCGGVVNDYVPFYFSPKTSFTYTISEGNVDVVAPNGTVLGKSNEDDRIFFVARPETIAATGLYYCFSDLALNANAPIPTLEQDLGKLGSHIHWRVFDDPPLGARIQEIGYEGVCGWFHDMASPTWRMNRSKERMAEFLARDAVPLSVFDCIVAKTDAMRDKLQAMMDTSVWNIPIYAKRGCYFK